MRTILYGLILGALAAAPALAHPHVWVVVKSEVILNAEGSVAAIRHHWTFDDMYSAFVTANIGKDGQPPTSADLAPVAKTNVESLAEFGFFTMSKVSGKQVAFGAPTDYAMTYNPADQTATLHFTLPFAQPAPTKRMYSFSVYDPSFFVSFGFDKDKAVTLEGGPPGCSLSITKPHSLDAADQQKLDEAFFANLSPGQDFGIKLAERAFVACP